jgi:hypothetical protein
MSSLVGQHLNAIRDQINGRSEDWIMREHNLFTAWLRDLNLPDVDTVEEQMIKILAPGPYSQVNSLQGKDINGYLFYTSAKDKKIVSQNNGVHINALDDRIEESTTYFAIIDDIWELHYGSNITISLFLCRWVIHPKGVQVVQLWAHNC